MEAKKDLIDQALEDIAKMRNSVRKMAEDSPDVKAGTITIEEELQEPGYVLYGGIVDAVASYFEIPTVQIAWRKIGESIGSETAAGLMSMMAVATTQCSYQSVLHYDSLLKEEITKQFDLIINRCNDNTADITACKGAISVLRTSIDKISTKLKLEEVMGEGVNIKPE